MTALCSTSGGTPGAQRQHSGGNGGYGFDLDGDRVFNKEIDAEGVREPEAFEIEP